MRQSSVVSSGDTDTAQPLFGEGLVLMVYGPSGFAGHPLPSRGTVVIGRERGADVAVDDTQVSRNHAALHVGIDLRVEDLGSANGTRVCGRVVAARTPIEVGLGDPIQMGGHVFVVQRAPTGERLRRVHRADYLTDRIEEECARDETFSIVRVAADGERAHEALSVLARELRPRDVIASYDSADHAAMLPDTGAELAALLVERIKARLVERELGARIAAVTYPEDGRSVDALIGALNERLTGRPPRATGSVVIASASMHAVYAHADRVAQTDVNVLIVGETGVGKDVLARHLHAASARAEKPFQRVNCAALSEQALAAELFGDAARAGGRPGALEVADGGTVYLDGISELPLSIQSRLVEVIESGAVRREGGIDSRPVRVRFVGSTDRDLEAAVARGAFRADLFYRIDCVRITIPPLRERSEEILPLARHFLSLRTDRSDLTASAAHALIGYPWPGNVRELNNVLERAALLASGPTIDLRHLPTERMRSVLRVVESAAPPRPAMLTPEKAAERERIVEALAATAGNQSHASRMLGIARTTLIARIEEYGIPRPRKR